MAATVIQRPFRGSRVSTFYPVKTLPPLSSLDSAFQLQEFISLLIRHNVHDVERIVALPDKPSNKGKGKDDEEVLESAKSEEKESEKAKGDITVDEACWIYEQLRRLAQDLTHPLITMLQQECNRSTCPEMKAGEWLYLCVAHGTDGAMEQCCAIDYILHTLDSATALLNSPRAFPSRLQIPPASNRHFSSLARRLGRIFAHAYFHHRDIFAQAEAESSLYARFLALTSRYDLVPADFIVIPSNKILAPDGEGDGGDIPRDLGGKDHVKTVIVPDMGEVRPPRLLAASLDPYADREKEDGSQRPSSAPPMNPPFNQTSVRVIGNRNNKSRNPPGLFVSNSGLMPVSATATAAPTTAASLFESVETPISVSDGNNNLSVPPTTGATLAPGQESPRKPGRPRTDTMIYSEEVSVGDGRGTSPIPVVRLGARLNDSEDTTGYAQLEVQEAPPTIVETKATEDAAKEDVATPKDSDDAVQLTDGVKPSESVPGDDGDVSSADFEPIDDQMEGVEELKEGALGESAELLPREEDQAGVEAPSAPTLEEHPIVEVSAAIQHETPEGPVPSATESISSDQEVEGKKTEASGLLISEPESETVSEVKESDATDASHQSVLAPRDSEEVTENEPAVGASAETHSESSEVEGDPVESGQEGEEAANETKSAEKVEDIDDV